MKQKCPVHRRSTGSTDPSVSPLMGTFLALDTTPTLVSWPSKVVNKKQHYILRGLAEVGVTLKRLK